MFLRADMTVWGFTMRVIPSQSPNQWGILCYYVIRQDHGALHAASKLKCRRAFLPCRALFSPSSSLIYSSFYVFSSFLRILYISFFVTSLSVLISFPSSFLFLVIPSFLFYVLISSSISVSGDHRHQCPALYSHIVLWSLCGFDSDCFWTVMLAGQMRSRSVFVRP
jgi:hypothetical protein